MTTLSDEELDRYARHIVLREIGGAGQAGIRAATVTVIGAGGIGVPVLQYLAAAGVGRLRVSDDDVVSLSNLQRQVIYRVADIGASKAERAAARIAEINPGVAVEVIKQRIDTENALELLTGDVIIDGSDNFATRSQDQAYPICPPNAPLAS